MTTEERIATALENIANSLSTLLEDTKANRELRIKNQQTFLELEGKIDNLTKDPFGLKEGN